jgi:hypothetical protein
LATFRERFPSKSEIVPVFASCVFPVFSWSIVWYLQKMPGWLPYLSIWKVLSILAYTQAFALFESVMLVFLLIALAAILPARWFKDRFIAQGSVIAFTTALWAILFQIISRATSGWTPTKLFLWLSLFLLSLVLSCVFIHRSKNAAQSVNALAERLSVFFYIYVPLGLVGLVIVIARNIL